MKNLSFWDPYGFAMGDLNRGQLMMVFDWHKVAQIIKDRNPTRVDAGLEGDWDINGFTIWENGQIVENDLTFLASTWARPKILIDGMYEDCFIMEDTTEWDSYTYWPDSARAILKKE